MKEINKKIENNSHVILQKKENRILNQTEKEIRIIEQLEKETRIKKQPEKEIRILNKNNF